MPEPSGCQNCSASCWENPNGLSTSVTLSRSGAARDPSSALKEDLFATAYHLPLNHVQDDWEVGVHDVLARGRHVRLRKPVAGLLQVHEDLLLERTQARTDQEALLYKRAGSQEAPYRSQNSEGWKTATLTQEVPGEGGGGFGSEERKAHPPTHSLMGTRDSRWAAVAKQASRPTACPQNYNRPWALNLEGGAGEQTQAHSLFLYSLWLRTVFEKMGWKKLRDRNSMCPPDLLTPYLGPPPVLDPRPRGTASKH